MNMCSFRTKIAASYDAEQFFFIKQRLYYCCDQEAVQQIKKSNNFTK